MQVQGNSPVLPTREVAGDEVKDELPIVRHRDFGRWCERGTGWVYWIFGI